MGLFSDITSAIGNIFGTNTQPSSDPDDNQKKKSTIPVASTNLTASKVNLPKVLLKTPGPPTVPKVVAPTVVTPTANTNLTATPPPPTLQVTTSGTDNAPGATTGGAVPTPPKSRGFFGTVLHDAGSVGKTIVAPAKYFGQVDIVDPATQLYDQATGNQTGANRNFANENVTLGLSTKNPKTGVISGNNLVHGLERLGGNTIQLGTDVAALPAGGVEAAAGDAAESGVEDAANNVISKVLPKIPGGVKTGSVFGAAQGLGAGMANDENVPQLAKDTVTGLGLGAVTGGIIDAVPVIRGLLSKSADEAAGDTGSQVADDTIPNTTEPEAGVKPPETPTNAPTGETKAPTVEPGATESGVKPNPVQPTPTTPTIVDSTPATPGAANTPLQAAPTPADVQAAEQATQAAVDKAEQSLPKPTAPAPTTAPAIAPAQAASDAAAEAPAQQAVVDEAPNVTFKRTDNPLAGETPTEANAPSPLGVKQLAVDKEADTLQQAKPEKGVVKLESLETRASKQGAPGREFVQRVTNARGEAARLVTAMRDSARTFFDLDKSDQNEAWLIQEGKLKPTAATSDKVMQAVRDLKTLMPKIQQEASQAGIKVNDLGPDYMPHIFEKGYVDKNFSKMAQHLVESDQAKDTAEATRLLNANRPYMGGRALSNLVKEREVNLPGYKTGADALDQYFQGAAKSIAQARQFGANNEEIAKLIDRANANGQDGKALADIFDKYWNPKTGSDDLLGKSSSAIRDVQNALQLQKSFISHTPQGFVNTGSKFGFTKYFKALGEQVFSDTDREYTHAAGLDGEEAHEGLGSGKIKNPFMKALQTVRKFNRQTAFIVGRNYADSLASKGDEEALRSLGITGDLYRDESGKITLTDAQKYQASHYVSDKTIFSTDPFQSSALTQGNAGKFVAQYRGQYVFKQAGFINNILKDAAHGNIAPAIRYLGIGVPIGGATVTAGKQLFEGKNPVTQTKNDLKSEAEQVLSNSGVTSAGAGAADDVANEVEYHTPAETEQNVAGTVTPSAGNVVETAQNVNSFLRGDKNPLIKQFSSYVPGGNAILNSRVGKIAGYVPPKTLTPAEQKFDNAWDANYNKVLKTLSPSFSKSDNPTAVKEDEKTRDIFQSLVQSDHTSTGDTILKTTAQTMSQAQSAVANPKALQAYQTLERSLPDHNPVYDLPFSKLQTYEAYEALGPGTPNRTVMEQKDPWLITEFNKEQTYYNKQQKLSNTVEPKGYVPYPNITAAQSNMMTELTNLASNPNRTTAQQTQYEALENNTSLQRAYTLLDQYTNAKRASVPGGELAPIPYPTQNLTPAMNALLAQEEALPSDTGAKTALIDANQKLWNQAQQIMAETTEYAANEYGGVVNQGGKEANLLKDQYELGQDDIAATKNANGTITYSLNPAQAYAGSTGSDSSYESASDKAYDADKAAGFSDDDYNMTVAPKLGKGLKASTKKYKAPKLLADKAPTGKDGNPFVQAISTTHKLKMGKQGNMYGHEITTSRGVKAA